jgi:hypothetical protein
MGSRLRMMDVAETFIHRLIATLLSMLDRISKSRISP